MKACQRILRNLHIRSADNSLCSGQQLQEHDADPSPCSYR